MHLKASFYTAVNETGRLAEACSDDESEEELYEYLKARMF